MITNVINEKTHWEIGHILINVTNWSNVVGFPFTCEVVSVFFITQKTEAKFILLHLSNKISGPL
jgi:hypothetical protein